MCDVVCHVDDVTKLICYCTDVQSSIKVWHPRCVSQIHKKECKPSTHKFNVAVLDCSYDTITRLYTRIA